MKVVGSIYQTPAPDLPNLAVVFVDDQLRVCIKVRAGTDGEALVRRLIREYEDGEHDA